MGVLDGRGDDRSEHFSYRPTIDRERREVARCVTMMAGEFEID